MEDDEHMGDSLTAPVWADAMSTRFHVMAATKGYQPSFLAIGDAFFYGRGGLPRYVYTLYQVQNTYHCDHNFRILFLLLRVLSMRVYNHIARLRSRCTVRFVAP